MTPRTLPVLAAAAVLATAAATWLALHRSPAPAGAPRAAVLPELAGKLDALTQVRLVTQGSTVAVTLQRTPAGWTVAERGGYPADAAKLGRTVLALAALRTTDTKTSDPALYSRLGVEDVARPAAAGVMVELTLPGGRLGLIVGKAAGATGTYVRRDGDAQSLEATPALSIDRDAPLWLDRRLMSIDASRVRSIEVTPLKGRSYSIRRERPEQSDFSLIGVPAGRKPYNPSVAGPQAQLLASLEFEDVRTAAAVDFASGPTGRAIYRTFDGLVVTLEGTRTGGKSWLRVQVAYDPEGATGKAADVRQEADSLTHRTATWAYELPAYRLDSLLRPVEDFLGP